MSDNDRLPDEAPTPSDPGSVSDGGVLRRLVRWVGAGILLVLLFATVMVQSGRGQRMLLDGVLGRAQGALLGELSVGGVRSGTLLTGATLTNITLTAEGGRRLLTADSLRLRYSPVALVAGRPRISSVVVFGLDLEISRMPSEERVNITRLIRPRAEQGAEAATSPQSLRFGRIGVREGLVTVLNPAPEGRRGNTVPSPEGDGELVQLAFEDLDFDVEDVVIDLSGGADLVSARLASLSMSASILEEPLQVDEAYGELLLGQNGIRISDGQFRLPGSLLRGDLDVGPREPGGPWTLEADMVADEDADLADLAWVDERIPAGSFRGAVGIRLEDGVEVTFRDFVAQVEASTLTASGVARFGEELSFEALDLTASPVHVDRLEPWIQRTAPLDGWLSGQVRLSGTLARTVATGRVTLVPEGYGGGVTTADFSGTIFSGANPGFSGFEARLDPVNYQVVQALAPAVTLDGTGTLHLEVSGRLNEAFRLVADATHRSDGVPESRALARGAVRRNEAQEWILDVQGDMAPLAMGLFAPMSPNVDLGGTLTGSWRASGRMRDLHVTADLDAAEGRVLLDGVFDMRSPGSFYRFDATAEEISLSTLTGRLPAPSYWSGGLSMEGRGIRLDSMDAAATLRSSQARIGGLYVDTITAHMRTSAGILTVDSLDAVLGGVHVSGDGRLGMAAPLDGEARLEFEGETLAGLRPLLLGDDVIAKDTLTALEATLLTFEGVDVEALPDTADVRMHGRVRGTARLVGSVDALGVDLDMSVRGATYGPNRADSATIVMTGRDLPAFDGAWDVVLDAYGVQWEGRSFTEVHVDGDMVSLAGSAALDVSRGPRERLVAVGDFALDSVGGSFALAQAIATVDSLEYALTRPTRLMWDSTSLSVENLEVIREGEDPMRLAAAGTLSRTGNSNFDLVVEGLHLSRLAQVVEMNDLTVGGHADLTISVSGPAASPRIQSEWSILDPRLEDVRLTRIGGDLEYSDKLARVTGRAWDDDFEVFSVDGMVPVDLGFGTVEDRTLSDPMDLQITADSLDASVALAYFGTLEQVVVTVRGSVRVRGTVDDPEPNGEVRLEGGGWSIEALGVRHQDVSGALTLHPDRTVDVDLRTSATGLSTVTGTLTLTPIDDPGLDLALSFTNFQAVDRLDVEGRLSGDLLLRGAYGRPRITGSLQVDAGTLFVDEFVRASEVVNLSDPRLFGADTTVFETQSLLRDLRNPFLQNLSVQIDLSVPRDAWLRSEDMAVEMGGNLSVVYDRIEGDIVLVGELQAMRGSYTVLGRTFDVTGGTVGFAGIPGINPTLDIQAMSRIRRRDEEPLEVRASVQGTLMGPRVELSTEEAGLVQSDLVSYLIFGRSSSELATGQQSLLGAQGAVAGAATTLVSGALATRLGAALSQGIGIDYLSITQAGDFGFASGFANGLIDTQIEVGQYVGQNAFIVLVFRPLQAQQTAGNIFGGARVELALNDDYTVEGFFEDRFLRSGSVGLTGLGISPTQVLGVFIFREWGY